jgi:hypothetical protein
VSSELVEIVKRDLKEVVEAEIKRFLERYEDCEIVDSIYACWGFYVVNYDVLIHGLPCDIKRKFVIGDNGVTEFSDITCYVEFEDWPKDKTLGWVRVTQIQSKCFVETHVDEIAIDKVARSIVRKIVKEAEKEQ